MKPLPMFIKSTAVYGDDERSLYRYRLTRLWDGILPRLCFVMLNPSTATEHINDPTVAKCMKWAMEWGYGSLDVVNLFAYRATKPEDMKSVVDPVGSRNDAQIISAAQSSSVVICAWGKDGDFKGRGDHVKRLLWDVDLFALRVSDKTRQPWHPLYLPNATKPVLWRPRA